MVKMEVDAKHRGLNSNMSVDLAMQNALGVHRIEESSDMADALKELNKDDINPETKMSDIDTKARLNDIEISGILTLDSLIALKFLPRSCLTLTRQKKRLSVSYKGLGRDEMIRMTGGVQAQAEKQSALGKLFGVKQK